MHIRRISKKNRGSTEATLLVAVHPYSQPANSIALLAVSSYMQIGII
jgi:hypothetical protein